MTQTMLHFRINEPHVIAENFGDEIIAINMEDGKYYSIEKTGVAIWTLANTGATLDDMVATITQHYSSDHTIVRSAIQQFVNDLQRANLVTSYTKGGGAMQMATLPPTDATLGFEPPILHEYTDMQDMLLLDPIHDVAETGWPHVKRA